MAADAGTNINSRFLDAGEEPDQVLLPIKGYAKEQLLPLEEAVQPIREFFEELDIMVDIAKRNCKKPKDGLSIHESASIHLYTMQWEKSNGSLYTILNQTLRSERREPLKPWFRYLKLFLTALYKLPSLRGTIWRGVRGNVSDQYEDDHIWWGFSSCTESVDVLEQFIGTSGVRTIFNIECMNGKAIREHSFYKKENEILLMPGTYFRVISKWSPAKDLYIIHLRETAAEHPYLEPPFASILQKSSVSVDSSPTFSTPETGESRSVPTSRTAESKDSHPFAVYGKTLNCEGRPCIKCGKCRDWYFNGNPITWQWIRNCKSWQDEDWKRWNDEYISKSFKRRNGATCLDIRFDRLYYDCLCEDNIIH